jgi:hypothetical protein
MPTLLGHVDTRLRPSAQARLTTPTGEPLLAEWQPGEGGRVAVFTSDATRRWAAAWLDWSGFGPFWADVVQRVIRPPESRPVPTIDGYPDEWCIRPTNNGLLRQLAVRTGGDVAPAPASLPGPSHRAYFPWPWLLAAIVLLALAERWLGRRDARGSPP